MSGQTTKPQTTTTKPTTTKQPERPATGSISVGSQITRTTKFGEANEGGIREDEVKAESGGMGGFMGNIADTIAGALNPKNTNLDDLPPDLLDMVTDGTLLRFAFGPEDMAALALGDEQAALEAVANVLTVNNPSQAVMEYLIGSDKFTDLIWSGHGSEDGLFTTGRDGKADLMENESVTELLAGSSISEVFLAVCNGGKDLDEMLNDKGMDTYAYDRSVADAEAIGDLGEYAEGGSLENVKPTEIEIPEITIPGFGTFGGYTYQHGGRHQRGKNPMEAMAAMGIDLSGIDFSGMNFGGMGLAGMDFSGLAGIDYLGLQGGTGTGTTASSPKAPKPADTASPAATKPPATTKQAVDDVYAGGPYSAGGYSDLGMTGYSLGGLNYF